MFSLQRSLVKTIMNVILKTGFEKVSHNIHFQPETMPKGIALVTAEHVRDVEEHRNCDQNFYIKANIIRQTSVTCTPYTAKLMINVKREVADVSCTCVYNKSKKCKHIAALIYYINNEESLSKTDVEQVWGRPTAKQFAQDKYSKGRFIFEMYPAKEKPAIEPQEVQLSELEDNSILKMMLAAKSKKNSDFEIKNLITSLLNQVEVILNTEICNACAETFLLYAQEYHIYEKKNKDILSEDLKLFYLNNIMLSAKEVIDLCCNTVEQANCDKWYKARSLRISASKNVHSVKTRVKKTVESLVSDMLYPKIIKNCSTQYGIRNEQKAKEIYEKLYNVRVEKVGLFVSLKQPWLCASLDGAVIVDDCIIKICEFKCPIACEKLPVIDNTNKTCNVNYLEYDGKDVNLKKSSIYYTQCQVQMYVTGMCCCDLFIYSPIENGCCCVEVHRDEKFLEYVIEKCEDWYFINYLPALQLREIKQVEREKRCFTRKDIANKM